MARPALPLLLLLVSVASLVVAGCVGNAQAASARQNLAPADEAAQAWDPGAKLAQVVGVEGTLDAAVAGLVGASGGDFTQAQGDETVGDGLAEVWAYRYVAAGKAKSYVVVLDKAGAILRQGEGTKRPEDHALSSWSLDSDQAVAIALQANAVLAEGVASEAFGIVSALFQTGEGPPAWVVANAGRSLQDGPGAYVLVDAVTGEVLSSEVSAGAF